MQNVYRTHTSHALVRAPHVEPPSVVPLLYSCELCIASSDRVEIGVLIPSGRFRLVAHHHYVSNTFT